MDDIDRDFCEWWFSQLINSRSGLCLPFDDYYSDFIDNSDRGYKVIERIQESSGLQWFSDVLEMLKASSFYKYKN